MTVRRVRTVEVPEVKALIRAVILDTYPDLPSDAVVAESDDWTRAHVAEIDGVLAGVVLATDDTVDDLWVVPAYHRRGLGTDLLAAAEHEIRAAGYTTAHLRCRSTNTGALAFYAARGWIPVRSYPHERFAFAMTDLVKTLMPDA